MQPQKRNRLIAGGAVLLILVIWLVSSYNGFVNREETVKKQWSEVQNTYQRRLDLIPSLVNVVKGVSDFEQTTLQQVAEARSRALSGMSNDELSPENYEKQKALQDSLGASANRMIVLIEKYPTLKGTKSYSDLQLQLEKTEFRIRVARNDFNKAVYDYNRKVRSFPGNLVAGLFGFKKKTGFQADDGAENKPGVKFK